MRCNKTEKLLGEERYVFQFVKNFPLSDIDMKEADANPARLNSKFDDERAYGYGQDMEKGHDFPAIVVFDIGDGLKKILVTGRHRIGGATAALKEVLDAYVIREPDPCRRELLIRAINCIEGSAPLTNERLQHIAEMKRKYPDMKNAALASIFRIKKELIEEYLKIIAVERRAEQLGVGALMMSTKITQKVKSALSGLHNDHAFIGVVQLIARWPNLRGTAGADLIGHLKAVRTESMAMHMLEDAEKEQVALEQDKKITKTPRATASKLMTRFRSVLRFTGGSVENAHLAGLPGATLQGEIRLVTAVRNFANEVIEELARLYADYERTEEWRKGKRDGVPGSERPSPTT